MPDTASPLSRLRPRATLAAEQMERLLLDARAAISAAHHMGYFERMELNHDTRFAWWPGQTSDGRKWPTAERLGARLMPGQKPDGVVFPWSGSSDARERLVEKVIREHSALKKLALQRRTQRIGPRQLSPDADPQAQAALWGQVSDYYEDTAKREMRAEVGQWIDIAQEYGSSLLQVGWKSVQSTVSKTLRADKLAEIVKAAAVDVAETQAAEEWAAAGGAPEEFTGLDAEQIVLIEDSAEARLMEMVHDPLQAKVLAEHLLQVDPEMPRDEALRLARELKTGADVEYYAVNEVESRPDYRALTFGVDCIHPPMTRRSWNLPWVMVVEWVTDVELRARVNSPQESYAAGAVEEALEHPGRAWSDLDSLAGGHAEWLLTGGSVRHAVGEENLKEARMIQVLHFYYLATAVGNVPALYHSVIHPDVDTALYHECCEHAHGRMPFVEHLSNSEAPYMLASEGYGEQSFTQQSEVKLQRDMRSDNASITIKPPFRVPLKQAGGKVDLRPGVQIPMRQTAGEGMLEPIQVGADARGSQEVEMTTQDSFNEYWARGLKIDPEIKYARRQTMVMDFLGDLEAVKVMTFQLIQQFSPPQLRAGFANGLPVSLTVSREEIQGMAAVEMQWDIGDLDPELQSKRWDGVTNLLPFDNAGLLNRDQILKAMTASMIPAHYKTLISDPDKKARDEARDEEAIAARILAGTVFDERSTLVPGGNHALRMEVLQRIFGIQADKKGTIVASQPTGPGGTLSRAQKLLMEEAEVRALVENRLRFHAFQLEQQQNAVTGKLGVEPVEEQSA